MKTIGFIDYYINEWHADNYPNFIKQSSYANKFQIKLAWEETSVPGRKNIDQWCAEMGIAKANSIEQVIDECDCIVVLSPDNPERHEDLTDLPLKSGKPVYVDKTFATSLASAKRMVEKARAHNTPMMTSSALRYDSKVDEAVKTIGSEQVKFMSLRGPGSWDNYSIHQVEPLSKIMGTGAKRIMQCGNADNKLVVMDYGDGRRAVINQMPNCPFQFDVQYGTDGIVVVNSMEDFFPRFIEAMCAFFETGKSSAPLEETLEVAAILEGGTEALKHPDEWVAIPQ